MGTKMTKREYSSGGIVVKRWGRGLRVLLIKDPYGRWTWPKGNIEKGESSKNAALREITEEVGLKRLKLLEKVGQTQYFYRLKSSLIFKTVYIYLISASPKERLKIQFEEIDAGKWFNPKQALSKVSYKDAPQTLKKALKIYKKYIDQL